MKRSYLLCGFAICSAMLFSGCNKNQVDMSSQETDQDGQETEYVQPVIWTGPGWYYGIWFSTEIDFNNWNHHHYHRHDHYNHDRHSDHHDRHRDSGNRNGDGHRDGDGHRSGDGHRGSNVRPSGGGGHHPSGGNVPHGGGGGGGHHPKGR